MIKPKSPSVNYMNRGFTLIEITIVLAIVTLLLVGLLPTISSQVEQQRTTQTLKQLDEIQQALIGFAIRYGRLPCPATTNSLGVENPSTGAGNCFIFNNGFVPAATLGIASTVDRQGNTGFAVDAWGNRIRYAVSSWSSSSPNPTVSNVFTTTNGIKSAIAGPNGFSNLSPNLLVCSTVTNITGTTCDTGKSLTTNGVPAVIFSTGKNGAQVPAPGSDEYANVDNNWTFVSHVPAPSTATTGEFDDLIIWISPNILINRMVRAGKLP